MNNSRTQRKRIEREDKRKKLRIDPLTAVTSFTTLLRNVHYFFTNTEIGQHVKDFFDNLGQ